MEQVGKLRIYKNKVEGYWYVLGDKGKGECLGMWGIKEDAVKFCENLNRKKQEEERVLAAEKRVDSVEQWEHR